MRAKQEEGYQEIKQKKKHKHCIQIFQLSKKITVQQSKIIKCERKVVLDILNKVFNPLITKEQVIREKFKVV